MSYSDKLNAIRAARAARDESKDTLYQLQLQYLSLSKEQKQFERKDITNGNKTDKPLSDLQKSLSDTSISISQIEAQIKTLTSLKNLLQEKQAIAQQLPEDILAYQNLLKQTEKELKLAESAIRRKQLEAQIKSLTDQIFQLQVKTADIKKDVEIINQSVQKLPSESALTEQKTKALASIDSIKKQLSAYIQKNINQTPDRSEELEHIKAEITRTKKVITGKDRVLDSLLADLFVQLTPQQLITEWNDQLPILLLPLRLETKFKISETTAPSELWVRVFPDDISVVTHEKLLTPKEVEYGIAHWKAIWLAKDNDDKKEDAWKILTEKFGLNRSAWIATETKPLNWKDAPTLPSEQALTFKAFDLTKPTSWTKAPHTRVMPDRFVLIPFRNGKALTPSIGKQITDILTLGPAPLDEPGQPSVTRNEADNSINFGEDFVWVKDFDKAVSCGMGFRLTLDNDTKLNGYDQLLVVGLKLSADQNDGQVLLEDLFQNHTYSTKGLSLIKQGTPTNNTEEADSGFSKKQTLSDIRKQIENNSVLFTPVNNLNEATDGQRLADYLGLNYSCFQTVNNSGLTDHMHAVAMNKALYAGTLGYFMSSMMAEVLNDDDILRLRNHFSNFVTGRGPLASIKVGKQPYGIVVTSAFDKWKNISRTNLTFNNKLYEILNFLQNEWNKFVPGLAHISKQGNASENLMKILGLNPTSTEFYQRVAYSYDTVKNMEEFIWGGEYLEDVFKMFIDRYKTMQLIKGFGYSSTIENSTSKPLPLIVQLIFQHYNTRIENKNLIDNLPVAEDRFIKPYKENSDLTYIDWLIANAHDSKKLEAQDFGGAPRPNSLLYMMLYNSLLHEKSHSIYKYLFSKEIVANEIIRSRKFMNMSSAPSVSHWEIFQAPVNKIVAQEQSSQPLFEHMKSLYAHESTLDIVYNLKEHDWALSKLKQMTTAELERALSEHIDTLSYRLDSWQTSLFHSRLHELRRLQSGTSKRQFGTYIGAYGYLENVKPGKNKRSKISERILPEKLREGKDNLFTETGNGGYVHTPTINHATASALLRNGYLTHATPSDNQLLAVNLSSERVRRAKYIVEGIKNGQTLESLLGYQFERGLHDWTTRTPNPVILNQLKPYFRKKYPIKKTKVPQEGKVTGPEEITEDYTVVNGLTLARETAAFPYGISFPTLTADQIDAIKKEKENLENTLDALRDLLISESAYQLALGNFDRAAGVMQSISAGTIPPDIEVIDSVKGTDLFFTNRVTIHFNNATAVNPWPLVAMTPRALAETGINNWLGRLLGAPEKIQCKVKAVNPDGTALTRPDSSLVETFLSLKDLGIQAADFVFLIANKFEETGTSELETRIRYAFAQNNSLNDSVIVKILFSESDTSDISIKSFAEVLPFANQLRNLLGSSRPLIAKDFQPASKIVVVNDDNPNNVNVSELQTRVQSAFNYLNNLINILKVAKTDAETLKTESLVNALRSQLKTIADSGYTFAFPQSCFGFDQACIDILASQAGSVITRFETFEILYNQKITEVNGSELVPDQKADRLCELMKGMLGDDFVVIPQFTFGNASDVSQAYNTRASLLNYSKNSLSIDFPVFEWQHGVALVRPKMHTLESIRLLNDMFNDQSLNGEPIQLPYKDNDSWLAVEYPSGTKIDHDTLSIIQYTPQGFDAGGLQCGLLIDEWTETIPNKEEETGITFNYNQPNSAPPQTILLTVSPELTGNWQWENLIRSILDTIDRAKRRAVEPDHVDLINGITTLLPATMAEFSTSKSGISLDYSLNIQFMLQEVSKLYKI